MAQEAKLVDFFRNMIKQIKLQLDNSHISSNISYVIPSDLVNDFLEESERKIQNRVEADNRNMERK